MVARDISDGFVILNALVLKKFEIQYTKGLHHQLRKLQNKIRVESFPAHNPSAIRNRNLKLQRLHNALFVLEHFAREKRITIG